MNGDAAKIANSAGRNMRVAPKIPTARSALIHQDERIRTANSEFWCSSNFTLRRLAALGLLGLDNIHQMNGMKVLLQTTINGIASIVFLFELTRDYNAILPLMLASVIADLVAGSLMRDSIMTEKLTRRGLRVPSDYHADVLRTTPVAAVMTTRVETVDVADPVAGVARRFQQGGHGAYPVMDDGRCVGIIARGDLLRGGDWSDDASVGDVAARDVLTVRPRDLVIEALELMLAEHVEHLPVVADGRLVGICTRTDIMRARREQFGHEKPQAGWRPRRRRAPGDVA